jgi:type II secretory pathway pseudopilin PulG
MTIVELLVVIVAIGILSAVVIPELSSEEDSQLRAAAEALAADVAYAQLLAIQSGGEGVAVVFNQPHNRYHLAMAGDPDTPITHPTNRTDYRMIYGFGAAQSLAAVRLLDADVGDDGILVLGSYGDPDQSTNAVITMGAGRRRCTVTFEPITGEPSISEVWLE